MTAQYVLPEATRCVKPRGRHGGEQTQGGHATRRDHRRGRTGGPGSLSDARREEVWVVLSDIFVDNEVDYEWIASEVADVNPDLLEEIFFKEVAPYCGPNLMSAIPAIWDFFDPDELVSGIREKLAKTKKSWIANLRYKCFVPLCRLHFKYAWKKLSARLAEHNNGHADQR